jgi:hypothetical protein
LVVDARLDHPFSKKDVKPEQDHWMGARLVYEEGNFEMQQKYCHKTSKNSIREGMSE